MALRGSAQVPASALGLEQGPPATKGVTVPGVPKPLPTRRYLGEKKKPWEPVKPRLYCTGEVEGTTIAAGQTVFISESTARRPLEEAKASMSESAFRIRFPWCLLCLLGTARLG